MNILVTGANGQLGRCLQDTVEDFHDTTNTWFWSDVAGDNCDYLDITDLEAVKKYFVDNSISICINCAAYTNVDKAEMEPELAEKLNADAPKNLADACLIHGTKLIHISTDYVFNGMSFLPIAEDRMTLPISVYGRTKLKGEDNIIKSGCKYLIFRTAWLYSEYGNNFVKTMMKLIREKDEIKVVNDQVGTPTYARDLARLLYNVAIQPSIKCGLYHFTNEGVCSWYDFATYIKNVMELEDSAKVKGVTTTEFYGNRPHAHRPYNSILSKEKVKLDFNGLFPVRNWMDAVEVCVEKIKHDKPN